MLVASNFNLWEVASLLRRWILSCRVIPGFDNDKVKEVLLGSVINCHRYSASCRGILPL